MDTEFYKKLLKEFIGIRVFYANNVRCLSCDYMLYADSASAQLYNKMKHCKCKKCKNNKFYDSTEKWVNTVKPMRPWTWFSGYWEKQTQQKGE